MAPNIFPPGTFLSFEEAQRQKATQPTRYTQGGRALIPDLITPGDTASEYSITVENDQINNGRATNIPSIYDGKVVSEEEAIRRVVEANGVDPETGRTLPAFNSIPEAVAAAKERSDELGRKMYQPNIQNIFPPGALPSLEETNIHDIYPPEEIEADTPIEAETPTEVPEPTDTPTPDPAESQGLLQQFLQNPNIQRALTTGLAGLGAGPYGAIEAGKQFDVRAKTKLEQEKLEEEKAYRERELELKEEAAGLAAEERTAKRGIQHGVDLKTAGELFSAGMDSELILKMLPTLSSEDLSSVVNIGNALTKEKEKGNWFTHSVTGDIANNRGDLEVKPGEMIYGPHKTAAAAYTMGQSIKDNSKVEGPQTPLGKLIAERDRAEQTLDIAKELRLPYTILGPLINNLDLYHNQINNMSDSTLTKALRASDIPEAKWPEYYRAHADKMTALTPVKKSTWTPEGLVIVEGPPAFHQADADRTELRDHGRIADANEDVLRLLSAIQPYVKAENIGPSGGAKRILAAVREQSPTFFNVVWQFAAKMRDEVMRDMDVNKDKIDDEIRTMMTDAYGQEAFALDSLLISLAYMVARSREQGRLTDRDVLQARRSIFGSGVQTEVGLRSGLKEIQSIAEDTYYRSKRRANPTWNDEQIAMSISQHTDKIAPWFTPDQGYIKELWGKMGTALNNMTESTPAIAALVQAAMPGDADTAIEEETSSITDTTEMDSIEKQIDHLTKQGEAATTEEELEGIAAQIGKLQERHNLLMNKGK